MLRARYGNSQTSRPLENTSRIEDSPAGFVAYIDQIDTSHLALGMPVIRVAGRAMKRLVAERFEKLDHRRLRVRIEHEIQIEGRPRHSVGGQPDPADDRIGMLLFLQELRKLFQNFGEIHITPLLHSSGYESTGSTTRNLITVPPVTRLALVAVVSTKGRSRR